ncbi:MAG: carboxypeptidase-like regulatory domain-containing protein [Bacteroidota bacterium]
MDNQDKIFNKIKEAAQKAEQQDFPGMDKVWARLEDKLDKKEDKRAIVLWKKLAIAASLLLFVSLGYQFLKTDSETIIPKAINENKVVIQKNNDNPEVVNPSETIKKDAVVILKKQLEKQAPLVISESNNVKTISSPEAITTAETEDNIVNNNKEIILNAAKAEAVAIVEKKAKTKITSDTEKRIITGIITDETNQPIPGANVFIKGTPNGAQTDIDGKFSIQAEKGEQLIFNTIGYNTSYAIVGESDKINTKLSSNSMALNEVVVVGYATSRQKEQAKLATARAVNSAPLKSEAKVLAKTIIVPQIKDALYIINEVEYSEASLFGINPTSPYAPLNLQKIETVKVLQNEEATAKFGEKGKNGAIIITTKKEIPLKR